MADSTENEPLDRETFRQRLEAKESEYYHDHPFHQRMHAGELSREEVQSWVLNRFYYQKMIPRKDAYFLANCPEREVRREWIQRILDHDGHGDDPGGIEKWLVLGEAVGLDRGTLRDENEILPGVVHTVDAYVNFVRDHGWVESAAASLTELFGPDLMEYRLEVFEEKYPWIDSEGLRYFRDRLGQAPRDAEYALNLVLDRCERRDQQERCIEALQFKCDLLWSLLDAIDYQFTNQEKE